MRIGQRSWLRLNREVVLGRYVAIVAKVLDVRSTEASTLSICPVVGLRGVLCICNATRELSDLQGEG